MGGRFHGEESRGRPRGRCSDWIDADGRSLGIHDVPCEDHEIRSALIVHCPFWHPTVLVRREALALVGGYRDAFVFAHDYDMELRVAEHFDCANLKQVVLKYRIHPSQVTFRKQRPQTLCKLAAQVSAASRRESQPDPLNAVSEITPALLIALGVSEAVQQNALVSDCRNWIRSMSAAGEYSAALSAAADMLKSASVDVERWQMADLHLTMAQLHWKRGEFLKAVGAAGRAVATRPLIIGRPIKAILRCTNRGGAS